MTKSVIILSDWPFDKGVKAKLIKISKPFLDNGRWYLNAVFMSLEKKEAKTLKRFWGDLHLLIVGAYYVDGIRLEMSDWQTETLDIKNRDLFNKRIDPYLKKDRLNEKYDYYTFGIGFDDKYYVFPLLEIVRAVFAPDVFWLNQITMLDTIDTRVLHEFDNRILKLNFSNDIPVRYIKMDATIKHMAWIFTNKNILKMFSQIYQNICDNKGVVFDFNFNDLAISFKYEESNRMRYIKEIIVFRRKRMLCDEIIVSHPSLIEHDENAISDCEKRVRLISDLSSGVKELSTSDGALSNFLDLQEGLTDFEYASEIKIQRVKKIRNKNKNKILHLNFDDKNGIIIRTTADFGGMKVVPQLEFFQSITKNLEGDFEEIMEIIRLMKKRSEVLRVEFHLGYLQNHLPNRVICTLDDGKTLRKYLVGKIKLHDGCEAVIIEIQRESKAISTLICVSQDFHNWEKDVHKLLKGFIKKSGAWSTEIDMKLNKKVIYRFKHTNAEYYLKEKRISQKILGRKE